MIASTWNAYGHSGGAGMFVLGILAAVGYLVWRWWRAS